MTKKRLRKGAIPTENLPEENKIVERPYNSIVRMITNLWNLHLSM